MRTRRRKTSKAVRIADRLAGLGIRLAGLGTIAAVLLVCVFLFSVAAPLFRSQSIVRFAEVAPAGVSTKVRRIAVDDYESIAWAYGDDAHIRVFDLAKGEALGDYAPFTGNEPISWTIDERTGRAAFGFGDGTVRLATLGFTSAFEHVPDGDAAFAAPAMGERAVGGGGVQQRISHDQMRVVRFSNTVDEPVPLADPSIPPSPIILLDQAISAAGPTLAGLTADCNLWLRRVYTRTNWMTGEETKELSGGTVRLDRCLNHGRPDYLMLTGAGDNAFLIWRTGELVRVDATNILAPRVAEQIDVLDDPNRPSGAGADRGEITAVSFLIGRRTLAVGDSSGTVRTWFRVKPATATTVDGSLLVSARRIPGPHSKVTALAPSARSRALAIGYADGTTRMVHVTSGNEIGRSPSGAADGPVAAIAIAPRDDAVFTLGRSVVKWTITPGHPEISAATLLRPVWYEGYTEPEYVWQSSSGSDEFEPKLGLIPLVFGTLKATFYSMLFGAPLALLAAIYTSEFLHPRVRARVKPMIELMASLPSVVLGFLAAIVFAPLVENVLPEILASLFALPFVLLLAAHVAQALPQRAAVRLRTWRLGFAALCLPVALALGFVLGGALERAVFADNFKLWLDGKVGGSAGAWTILLIPAAAFVVALAASRSSRSALAGASQWKPATWLLARYLAGAAATIMLALVIGSMLAAAGLDVRGTFVGTYVQRNAMVVGFVMGFAIIPIIYTISEDALSSVPEHLRAGSLALGATRWQTAVRIVVPTAMSGLFSALMIGLGRAVGETMIVLMAAGNTPVLEWNVFSGLRTLSANIAVELPEAVRNSTHYRTLFLAALCLFAMTFTLNTVAEIVRLRFRKRAYQL